MSFELIRPVAVIESPDVTQKFKVTKGVEEAVNIGSRDTVLSTAKIFLANKLIDRVVACAADFPVTSYKQIADLPGFFFHGKVVVCGPEELLQLRDMGAEPPQAFVSVNLSLPRGRLTVIDHQLKESLVDYLLDFTPEDALPADLRHQAELKLKFHLDGAEGFIIILP